MVLWSYTVEEMTRVGHTPQTPHFVVLRDLTMLTLSTFFLGSYLSLLLERVEGRLRRLHGSRPTPSIAAYLQYSDVLQNVLGFIAGGAALDMVTSALDTLGEGPTFAVLVSNVMATLFVTAAACWYIAHGGRGGIGESREDMERYFITSSSAFFVGWMWLVVARDVVTIVGEMLLAILSVPLGEKALQQEATQGFAQVLSVLIFCPGFSAAFVVWQVGTHSETPWPCATGTHSVPATLHTRWAMATPPQGSHWCHCTSLAPGPAFASSHPFLLNPCSPSVTRRAPLRQGWLHTFMGVGVGNNQPPAGREVSAVAVFQAVKGAHSTRARAAAVVTARSAALALEDAARGAASGDVRRQCREMI